MWSQSQDDEWIQPFFIGHHSTQRTSPVTAEVLDQANACNYDMLTTQITNSHFCSRVLELVSKYRAEAPDNESPCPRIPELTHHDTPLSPGDITSQLLGFTSSWIDICSPDPLISGLSRQVLSLEIAYAAFCGLEYVFVTGPRLYHQDAATQGTLSFARAIQEVLAVASHMQVSVVLPMIDEASQVQEYGPTDLAAHTKEEYLDEVEELRSDRTDLYGFWDAWNLIRSTCKYNTRLSVALNIPNQFPTTLTIQSRWYSEPVKAIMLSASTFEDNKHGNPTLPAAARAFVSRLMRVRMGPWILLQDVDPIPPAEETTIDEDGSFQWKPAFDTPDPTPAEAKSQKSTPGRRSPFVHLDYLRWIQKQQPPRTAVEKYGSGYQDYLQVPLQPLTDNLESMTYEIFEKDPVKYDLYEEAIRRALREWADKKKPTSGPNGKVVVAVAGAGRGPLVTRALRASETEGVEIDMWAVEKNPNAYVLLQRHNQTTWNGRVSIVKSDMRSWKGPWRPDVTALEQPSTGASASQLGRNSSPPISVPHPGYTPIDILISELLGSFADNELSPECLDGILHLLGPDGISIPRSYTAYLTPIAAPKLHTDILSRSGWDPTAPETPSVVWLHAIDYLSTAPSMRSESYPSSKPQQQSENSTPGSSSSLSPFEPTTPAPSTLPNVLPVWSFHHKPMPHKQPFPVSNAHNERYARLNFRTRDRGVCHGFGGYFESVLYPGVELSTNPNTMEAKSKAMISWFPIFFPLKVGIVLY